MRAASRQPEVLDPPEVMPPAVDRDGLIREARRQRALLRRDRARGAGPLRLTGRWLGWRLAQLWTLLPARLLMHYLFHGGPLMAAGLAYNMLFASVAVLVIGFAVAGRVLGADSALRELTVEAVSQSVPGLINTGRGGVIPLSMLESAQPFTITGLVAAAVLAFTAWRWASGIRLACRRLFEVPPSRGAPAAAVPRDVMGLLVMVVVLALSLALNVQASGVLQLLGQQLSHVGWLRPVLGVLDGTAAFGLATFFGVVADGLMLVLMVRGVAQLRPGRMAWACLLVFGVTGNMLLREVGGMVIGAMAANPYLYSIALVVGVLFWFYFFSQVLLVATAFAALVQADLHGGHAQPHGETRAVTAVAVSALDDVRAEERSL